MAEALSRPRPEARLRHSGDHQNQPREQTKVVGLGTGQKGFHPSTCSWPRPDSVAGTVDVYWPSGKVQRFENLNGAVRIDELSGAGSVYPAWPKPSAQTAMPMASRAPDIGVTKRRKATCWRSVSAPGFACVESDSKVSRQEMSLLREVHSKQG